DAHGDIGPIAQTRVGRPGIDCEGRPAWRRFFAPNKRLPSVTISPPIWGEIVTPGRTSGLTLARSINHAQSKLWIGVHRDSANRFGPIADLPRAQELPAGVASGLHLGRPVCEFSFGP